VPHTEDHDRPDRRHRLPDASSTGRGLFIRCCPSSRRGGFTLKPADPYEIAELKGIRPTALEEYPRFDRWLSGLLFGSTADARSQIALLIAPLNNRFSSHEDRDGLPKNELEFVRRRAASGFRRPPFLPLLTSRQDGRSCRASVRHMMDTCLVSTGSRKRWRACRRSCDPSKYMTAARIAKRARN